MFKIEPNEFITNMFIRFADIINGLKSLEKYYTNNELICKIFRSLSKVCKAKITTIQEVEDLNTLLLKEFLDFLMTHELTMKQNNEEGKKKETITFKSTTIEDEQSNELEEGDEEDDLVLVARRFK